MKDDTVDVLPKAAVTSLSLAWIVLFAGRWICAPFLLAGGMLSPAVIADLDDRILTRIYLVLLAITVVVIVLRAMRGSPQQSDALGAGRPKGPVDTSSSPG